MTITWLSRYLRGGCKTLSLPIKSNRLLLYPNTGQRTQKAAPDLRPQSSQEGDLLRPGAPSTLQGVALRLTDQLAECDVGGDFPMQHWKSPLAQRSIHSGLGVTLLTAYLHKYMVSSILNEAAQLFNLIIFILLYIAQNKV